MTDRQDSRALQDQFPIVVLGGSFDPVHIGHLILATRAAETLGVPEVLLVPANQSPGKSPPVAAPGARLAMLHAAVVGRRAGPRLTVSDIEIRRGGTSFTIDTVEQFRRSHADREVIWITGADALGTVGTWHRAAELVQLCRFAVAGRPTAPELAAGGPVVPRVAAQISMPLLEVSSTDIRRRVAAGQSVRWMLPDSVLSLIERDGLYGHPGP